MIWLSANPGCGKSVSTKFVAGELVAMANTTTCYFFFRDTEEQTSARSALSCILHQLFTQREDIFSEQIVKKFELRSSQFDVSVQELWDVLLMASEHPQAGEIVCILDALDECNDSERKDLVKVLRDFYDMEDVKKNTGVLKFFVTSRPYDSISRGFGPLDIPGLPIIHLKGESDEMSKLAKDIEIYIRFKVLEIRTSLGLQEDEEQLLLKQLLQFPNQTYLWVSLILKLVEEDISIDKSKIRTITTTLPQEIDDIYEKILSRSTDPREARKLLHIVVAAAQPLTVSQMNLAMTIRKDHSSSKDCELKPEKRFRRYVRDLCGLFINIEDSRIYLLHQTAKEFLIAEGDVETSSGCADHLLWKASIYPRESALLLCQICMWTIRIQHLDLIFYAQQYWTRHFQESETRDRESIRLGWQTCMMEPCKEDILSQPPSLDYRVLPIPAMMFKHTATELREIPRHGRHSRALIVASSWGLQSIVKFALGKGDVEAGSALESSGCTPGIFSSPDARGEGQVINVEEQDWGRQTALSNAALHGHTEVVKLLIQAGARVDSVDLRGLSPFEYALMRGHLFLASQMIEEVEEVTSRKLQSMRDRLLLFASEQGDDGIVARLLSEGVNFETTSSPGNAALISAAALGKCTIVELLLEAGASVEAENHRGRTALMGAAQRNHVDVVRALLRKGGAIDARDFLGNTALMLVAENSRAALSLSPFTGDHSKTTALIIAAWEERCDVARLLLTAGASVNVRDKRGRTLLSILHATWQTDAHGGENTVQRPFFALRNVGTKNTVLCFHEFP